MTTYAAGRGPLVMLGSLAVLLSLAGLLPWLAGGSGAARAFGTPLLLVGLFAGFAVLRAGRSGAREATGPTATTVIRGCGGCTCGSGGCQGTAR